MRGTLLFLEFAEPKDNFHLPLDFIFGILMKDVVH